MGVAHSKPIDHTKRNFPMVDLASINEEALKIDTIAALAEEAHQPASVVKDIFNEQYMRLKQTARIPDYLVLFATRRTRDALAKQTRSHVVRPDVNARFRADIDNV
jgi:hypothetical protein